MSIPLTIPVTARPFLTANTFTATFNAPTLGRYDFNVAANQNNIVIPIRHTSVYVLERINFSASVPEGVYQEAIDPTNLLPNLQLLTTVQQVQIFPEKQPFINYVDNLSLLLFFHTTQDNDNLLATFTGQFTQPAFMVGMVTMDVYIQFNIYEINDTDWVARYHDRKLDLGRNLKFRGR